MGDIKGEACYLDDIVVTGCSEQDHLSHLRLVMEKLNTAGLCLKLEKCHFFQESVTYLSHVLDKTGIHPNPDKIKVITAMLCPQNQEELQSFLDMVNYYARFISGLGTNCACLNNLLQKHKKWQWSSKHTKAMESIKKLLTSADALAHYDPSLPLSLVCDTSPVGIGAVIFHTYPDGKEKPIAYVSCKLTSAEQNYAQIRKEALGIIFGVQKFRQYLLGHNL